MNLLAWLLVASAAVLNGHAIVAVLLAARDGSSHRIRRLAITCGCATLAFVTLWEGVTVIPAIIASPPPGASPADQARWRASNIAGTLYSAVFVLALALLPAAAALWLHHRRRRAEQMP